jgi:hypothetical protein
VQLAKSNGIVTANSTATVRVVRIILIVSWSGYGKAHAVAWASPFTLTTSGLSVHAYLPEKKYQEMPHQPLQLVQQWLHATERGGPPHHHKGQRAPCTPQKPHPRLLAGMANQNQSFNFMQLADVSGPTTTANCLRHVLSICLQE